MGVCRYYLIARRGKINTYDAKLDMIEIEIEDTDLKVVKKEEKHHHHHKGRRPKKHKREKINKDLEAQTHKKERYLDRRERSNARKEYQATRTK